MVPVGGKPVQQRTARAIGRISISPEALRLVRESQLRKGDALGVARLAGIMAAKRTAELVPLCHPLPLDHVAVDLRVLEDGIEAVAEVSCHGRTGVEMEALCAVEVALLTVYDMCKSVDRDMTIGGIRLLEKTKSDDGAAGSASA